jgi:hypothetical protein
MTLAGRAIARNVSFLSPPRTHAGDHELSLRVGRSPVAELITTAEHLRQHGAHELLGRDARDLHGIGS